MFAGQAIISQVRKCQLLLPLGTDQPTVTVAELLPSTSVYFSFGFIPLHVSIFLLEFFSQSQSVVLLLVCFFYFLTTRGFLSNTFSHLNSLFLSKTELRTHSCAAPT